MRRKITAAVLTLGMVGTLLTGCGEKAEPATAPDATTADPATTAAPDSDAPETPETAEETEADTTAPDSDVPIVSKPTEITFIFADGDAGAKETMTEIVNRFNEAYDDITVNIEPGNGGTYSEFLKTKESVGEFPDVMEMRDTAIYYRAGMLEPLSDDIVSLFTSTVSFGGETYTAPLSGENTDGIIYNKKYFDENGFTEPTTYDEFLELCQAIKDKGDMSPLVIGGQDIWHVGFWFDKVYTDQVISQDPDFIKHCYDGSKNFSDPTMKQTFEELKNIFQYAQEGWVSTPDAQITTFLVSNMSAMMYSGTHMFAQIASADPNFEMGWFPIPSPDGKLRLVGGGGIGGLAISAESAKDPDKKAAAEEFIRFFFAPENYKMYLERLSFMPTTVDVPTLDVTPVFQEVIDAVAGADAIGPMWNGRVGDNELPPDFRNFMYKTVVEVIQGQRDIDSACEELNKTWEVGMQNFNPLTAE